VSIEVSLAVLLAALLARVVERDDQGRPRRPDGHRGHRRRCRACRRSLSVRRTATGSGQLAYIFASIVTHLAYYFFMVGAYRSATCRSCIR